MSYLAVAYPKLSQEDYDWIQSYREKNDERFYSVVEPHFTLVFAIDGISERDFVSEVKTQLASYPPIEFVCRVATVNSNHSKDYYQEFLVPDIGYSKIVKLHDRLYSEAFRDYLRLDIDYIPHIGIGTADDPQTVKHRVDQLNVQDIEISGLIDEIDVIFYDGDKVVTVSKITLT